MTHGTRLFVCLLVLVLLGATLADQATEKTDRKATDTLVYNTLREIINRGADLYNSGDHSGCYRLYEGALLTIRPQLEHRANLQKSIARGIGAAEKDPVMWRRAFALRRVLDEIREDVNPNAKSPDKAPEKLSPPKDDDNPPEVKKAEPKKPEPKKPEPKSPDAPKDEPKKPEPKSPDAPKDEPKKPEPKSPDAPKDEPKKPEPKSPDAPKEAPGKPEPKKIEVKKPEPKKDDKKPEDDKKDDS